MACRKSWWSVIGALSRPAVRGRRLRGASPLYARRPRRWTAVRGRVRLPQSCSRGRPPRTTRATEEPMTISAHLENFAGLKVVAYDPESGFRRGQPGEIAYCL